MSSHIHIMNEEHTGVITRYSSKQIQPERIGKRFNAESSQCTTNNDDSSSTMSSHIHRMDEEHSGVITRYGSKQIQPEQIGKCFNAESSQCTTNTDDSNSTMSSHFHRMNEEHSGVITRYGSKQIQPEQIGKRSNAESSQCTTNTDDSSSTMSSHFHRMNEEHSGVITRYGSKQIQPEQIGKRFNAESSQCTTNTDDSSSTMSSHFHRMNEEHSGVITRYGSKQIQPEQIGKRFNTESSQCTTITDDSSSTMSTHFHRMDEEHSGVITRYGSKQIQPEQIGKRFNTEYDETNSSMSSPIEELDEDNTGVITRSGSKVKQPHLTRKRFNAKIIKLSKQQYTKKKKNQVQGYLQTHFKSTEQLKTFLFRDILTWEMCMNTRSLNGARRLLKRGHLPVWKRFKHFYTDASCKKIFLLACQHISKRIKATSDNILQVYPAYRADGTKSIVFVVITKVESDNVVPEDYPVMCRCVDEYSNEGQDIKNYRLSNNIYLTEEEAAKLQKCIQKNSEQLMKEHSNLTMISGCPCKSANYGDKQVLIKETCIVLYVRVKGLIPISEKQFKTRINGIRVDVREGGFRFYGGAKTRQDRLCVGCQISSSMIGTLGMFMDYKNTTCCVTSAHVVLDDASMRDLISNSHKEWKIDEAPKVFQPHSTDCKDVFGHVIQAWYRSGEENKAGTEIALIAIENRHPISGRFPEQEGTDENSKLQFSSGQICVRSQSLVGSEVLMFGSETEKITRGRVLINVSDIKYEELHLTSGYKFPFKNQIVIDELPNQVFAKPGDSGAVVFMKFQEIGSGPELKALGIFEGKTCDNRYLVTPIWDILEVLSHPQITNFQTSSLEEQITKLERTMNQRFEKLENLIVQGTSQNNC